MLSHVIIGLVCLGCGYVLINQSFVGTPAHLLDPPYLLCQGHFKDSGKASGCCCCSHPSKHRSTPEHEGLLPMNIGFATPASGNYLHILPALNLYFMEDDDMLSTNTYLAAVEIGWLGFSLWFESSSYS